MHKNDKIQFLFKKLSKCQALKAAKFPHLIGIHIPYRNLFGDMPATRLELFLLYAKVSKNLDSRSLHLQTKYSSR